MYTVFKCWFCDRDIKYTHPIMEPVNPFGEPYDTLISLVGYLEHDQPAKMLWDCVGLMVLLSEEYQAVMEKNLSRMVNSVSQDIHSL